MSDPETLADTVRRVREFLDASPWADDVPSVASSPVREWGTLAWARLALALVAELRELNEAELAAREMGYAEGRESAERDLTEARAQVASLRDAAEDFIGHFKTQQIAWHPLFRALMAALLSEAKDAPPLERVLRDPTVIVGRDHEVRLADGRTLAEHMVEWQNAPSNTASADSAENAEIRAQEETRRQIAFVEHEMSALRHALDGCPEPWLTIALGNYNRVVMALYAAEIRARGDA